MTPEQIPLSQYCLRITKGTTPTTLGHAFVAQGINFIKSEAITPDGRVDPSTFAFIDSKTHSALSRSILQESDILFSMAGMHLGKTAVVPASMLPANTNQAVGIIRVDKNKADPRFIHYVLSSPSIRSWVHRSVAQSAQPNFNLQDIGNLPIPSFRVNEQQEIAGNLAALDDKIELNHRMNETLEAISRSIFKSWFVDFDPVYAKAAGRQPFGMDSATAALLPNSFQDSSLGQIPKGWQVTGLDQIASFLNGLALQKYPANGGDFLPAIKIAQLRRGTSEGADHVSSEIPPDYVIHDGDVLFSWSGSLEVVVWCGGLGALNQHLFKVYSADYPKWFYYYWTIEHLANFQHIAAGKATTMGHIQRHHLSEAKVALPPQPLIQEADRIIGPIFQMRILNSLESRTLTSIRDALLPKLITGEIRIKDAERLVGEKV